MVNVAHSTLTGASLHEPKGVASASANTVYAANGSGSGAWTDVNTLVTATNFTTGDAKLTFKTTADSSWVMMNDGSIGSALSSATTRANADCEDLFTLFWNNISDTWAPVSTGRGANAAADWAAHKTITLPKELGRALVIAGSGSGLTARTLGATAGAETVVLDTTMVPAHTHSAVSDSIGAHTHSGTTSTPNVGLTFTGPAFVNAEANAGVTQNSLWRSVTSTALDNNGSHTHTFTTSSDGTHQHSFTTGSAGGGAAHANVQPSSFINIMVKL